MGGERVTEITQTLSLRHNCNATQNSHKEFRDDMILALSIKLEDVIVLTC